jgi:hypothetical protein
MSWRTRRLAAALAVAALLPCLVDAAPASAAVVRFRPTPVAAWRLNGVGFATTVVGNTVYVGGQFTTATSPTGQSVARANLAAFDATTGALRTAFVANTNGVVRSLASDGSRLFVGGSFTTIGGQSRSRLAAVDLTSGAVSGAFRANANSHVYALSYGGGRVYAGGSFSTISGVSRSRIAALSPTSGGAISGFAPSANGTVAAVAATPDGSAVYVGGAFTTLNGVSRPYLGRLSSSGARVNLTFSPVEGPVFALSVRPDGTRVAAAVGGAGNQGAYYNTSTGGRLWRQRCDGDGQAVWLIEDSMFTGFHEACDGNTSLRVTANATSNGARDTSFRPTFDRFWGARAIGGNSGVLVVAGDFTRVNGVAAQGFALFRRA